VFVLVSCQSFGESSFVGAAILKFGFLPQIGRREADISHDEWLLDGQFNASALSFHLKQQVDSTKYSEGLGFDP
jgi:hypothetical protein